MKKRKLSIFGLLIFFLITLSPLNSDASRATFNSTYTSSIETIQPNALKAFEITPSDLTQEEYKELTSLGMNLDDAIIQRVPLFDGPNRQPVWSIAAFNVTKTGGRKVIGSFTVLVHNNAKISQVTAWFITGVGTTDRYTKYFPGATGVYLERGWGYSAPGSYSVGARAQIITNFGGATVFTGIKTVVIF